MKKKILSIALVLGILLGLLGSIPTGAVSTDNRSLEYAFFDYEDEVNNFQGASLVDGGIAGSAKCLKYTSTATTYEDKLIYLGGSEENVQGIIPEGATFKLSFYVKLSRALITGNFVLKLSNGDEISASVVPTNTNDWQKVSFSKKATEAISLTSLSIRFGSASAGNLVSGGAPTDSRSYYIDDMEISVSSPYYKTPGSTPMTLNDYSMDFEYGSSICAFEQKVSETLAGNSSRTVQLVEDPTDSSNTVMKVWMASNFNAADIRIGFYESTQSSTTAKGTIPAGGKIIYTFKYYLPQEMESANNPSFSVYLNGVAGHADPIGNVETAHNQWHTATLVCTYRGATPWEITGGLLRLSSNNDTGLGFKRNWIVKGKPIPSSASNLDLGDRIMYLDDFRVTIEGPASATTVKSLDNYNENFEEGSSIQVNGTNVTDSETGTVDEKAQIVADSTNAANKVMKVSLSGDMAGDASTIKFGASKSGTTLAEGKIPAGGKITYKFKYYLPQNMANNNSEFSVAHGNGDVLAISDTAFDATANQWHNAVLTYKNLSLEDLVVGEAQLRYCGANNATGWVAEDSNGFVIYFDDFEVVTTGPAFPESSALTFTGTFAKGQQIVFSQAFTPSEEGATDKSIVRFVSTTNGVKGSLGSCVIGEPFTVPAIPVGTTLGFEVVPADSTGSIGNVVSYPYATVVGNYGAEINLDITPDGVTTAAVTVENNKFDGSDIRAILIVVLFNEDGAIVKSEAKPIICASNGVVTDSDGTLVVTPDAGMNVVKANAYLWYCTGNDVPSYANTTMDEVVKTISVTK